jgi:hypothetical protein
MDWLLVNIKKWGQQAAGMIQFVDSDSNAHLFSEIEVSFRYNGNP